MICLACMFMPHYRSALTLTEWVCHLYLLASLGKKTGHVNTSVSLHLSLSTVRHLLRFTENLFTDVTRKNTTTRTPQDTTVLRPSVVSSEMPRLLVTYVEESDVPVRICYQGHSFTPESPTVEILCLVNLSTQHGLWETTVFYCCVTALQMKRRILQWK